MTYEPSINYLYIIPGYDSKN